MQYKKKHYNNVKANSNNNIPFGVCKPLPSTSSSSVPLIPSPFGVGDGIRGTEEDEVEGSGLHTPNGKLL